MLLISGMRRKGLIVASVLVLGEKRKYQFVEIEYKRGKLW